MRVVFPRPDSPGNAVDEFRVHELRSNESRASRSTSSAMTGYGIRPAQRNVRIAEQRGMSRRNRAVAHLPRPIVYTSCDKERSTLTDYHDSEVGSALGDNLVPLLQVRERSLYEDLGALARGVVELTWLGRLAMPIPSENAGAAMAEY